MRTVTVEITRGRIVVAIMITVLVVVGMVIRACIPDHGIWSTGAGARPAPTTPTSTPVAVDTFTAEGTVSIGIGRTPKPLLAGEPCTAPAGHTDIADGTRVVITDVYGAVLATTFLRSGYVAAETASTDLRRCSWDWSTTVPVGRGSFCVEVAQQGQVVVTEDQLRDGVNIALGR